MRGEGDRPEGGRPYELRDKPMHQEGKEKMAERIQPEEQPLRERAGEKTDEVA